MCGEMREQFSAYLDGALDGRSMGQLAHHFESCDTCRLEFDEWQGMQSALGQLGQASIPETLQAQLRDTLAGELQRGTYLSPLSRVRAFCRQSLMPAGLRLSAGLAGALLLVSGLTWIVGTAAPVQANDDRLTHLNPPSCTPRYPRLRLPPAVALWRFSWTRR